MIYHRRILRMNNYFFLLLFFLFFLFIPIAYADTVRFVDTWDADQGSTNDGVIFTDYDLYVKTTGISSGADMLCYDWDNNGTFDNCYYDSNGCGGSCNNNTCDGVWDVPENMNDNW